MFEVSTASREGLRELTFALWNMVDAYQAAQPEVVPRRPVIRPIPVDQTGFTVEPDPENRGGFVVRGVRPERWIAQTNFDNDEAVATSVTGWPASVWRTNSSSSAPSPAAR